MGLVGDSGNLAPRDETGPEVSYLLPLRFRDPPSPARSAGVGERRERAGPAHLGGEGEVRGAEPGGGPGARQWAAAGSAPRARAAVAPSRCLARGGERGGEEPRALQPPSGHEDGRGLRQDAAAVREPGPGRSGGGGGGGQRPAPQPQRPRAGARAAARAAAAAAEGPARTAAERADAAEEAERRWGPGEWRGPAAPGRCWAPRTHVEPAPTLGAAGGGGRKLGS